jgi:hypothetical protein
LPVQKPKLLLLDANVIIDAYFHGIWDLLKKKYQIAVPSVVAKEARYFESETKIVGINLKAQADLGEINILEGTVADLDATFSGISPVFMAGVDAGEQEAIALIKCGKCAGYSFCTGDTNAIQALGLLGLEQHSVSFESVVDGLKMPQKILLDPSVSAHAHKLHIGKGKDLRMSGIYEVKLKKKR